MIRRPNLYRTPVNPGFLGSYDWRATLVGVLSLIVSCFAGTEYIASRWRFQPALGRPLFRAGAYAVYQPFEWIVWGWRYCLSREPRIRDPLFHGEMIVFAGSVLTAFGVFVAASRRARRLSRNAEDLHGSARLANSDDVRSSGLLASSRGVYVGGWRDDVSNRLQYLRHNGPEHILAFAPTRSGKGVSLVIPTLLAWEDSAVIYDIKGENWAKTAGYRASQGQLCFKFSPVEQNSSSRFNPLQEVRLFTPRDVSDAQNIAKMLVWTGLDSPQERYWQEAAESIMTGMILHVCYAAALSKRVACLADLADIFTRPGATFRETLEDLLNFQHDPRGEHNWWRPDGTSTRTHPTVRKKVQEMLNKEEKDFSGVLSSATTALTLYSDPLVAANTSASDFSVRDLVSHTRPVSLYLVVPPSDKERLRPLVRLIFTLVVNRLTERMEFQGADQKANTHRLLLLIDEFPSLRRMDIFADALSYMAGYGIKAYLITQDIRQIVDAYGVNESIVSNCHVRVAFAPNQQDTAELLSKMTGVTTVAKASYSFSGSRLSPVMGHMNASVDHIERPLMTPDEVQRIKPARKQGEGNAERIVEPGDMLIFVSGLYPILGTQMLYFSDPVLAARAKLAPPSAFWAVEEKGRVAAQRALNRTRREVSPPEPVEGDDASQMEGFIEEITMGEGVGHADESH